MKVESNSWSRNHSGSRWQKQSRSLCGPRLRRAEMKWWQIRKRNADLERELQSDLELEKEEQRERGLSSKEAHYAALRALGNPTLIREQTRATWSWSWLESLASDLKYGIRGMFRNPGST